MFGPGQIVTASNFFIGGNLYFRIAELLNPMHRHSLERPRSDTVSHIHGPVNLNFAIAQFSFSDRHEKSVHIGSVVNSVLETRCFSVQGLPGFPLFIRAILSFSALVPFR